MLSILRIVLVIVPFVCIAYAFSYKMLDITLAMCLHQHDINERYDGIFFKSGVIFEQTLFSDRYNPHRFTKLRSSSHLPAINYALTSNIEYQAIYMISDMNVYRKHDRVHFDFYKYKCLCHVPSQHRIILYGINGVYF